MTTIDKKVLAPIKNELGEKYKLEIIKQYDNTKRGRPSVCGFKFTFLKDSDLNLSANDENDENDEVIDVEFKALPSNSKGPEPQKTSTKAEKNPKLG